ncbi:MAG: hypothetical protein K8S16_10425 [Bacteroidales bacterium]|nr:hypothetical protein [Bacteroidales bacterium]
MKHLLSTFFLFCGTLSFTQNLQFFKEKLDFTITNTEFTVDGIYFFRNNTQDTIRQYLLYPFTQNPELGEVTSIKGNSIYPEMKNPVIVNFDQKAARFKLLVYPNDTAVVRIIYKQAITNNKAEYILTSTKAWNRPLEQADFTLKIPIKVKIEELSYDADSLLIKHDHLLYKWYFKDFMPPKNFFVSFSEIE